MIDVVLILFSIFERIQNIIIFSVIIKYLNILLNCIIVVKELKIYIVFWKKIFLVLLILLRMKIIRSLACF